MDLQTLQYFVSVAESLSFTEAAMQTGVSQSAISQQISELEKELGAQLIIRNKRPLQLTYAGKILLEEAYSIINYTSEAIKKVHLASKGMIGYLNVGFLGGIEKVFLPQCTRVFRQLYPKIYVDMRQYNWSEINEALMKEELDVGFTLSYHLNDYPDLIGKSLRRDFLCLAVHETHHLAKEKSINVSELSHEPFVTSTKKVDYLLNEMTYKVCADHGFTPNIVYESKDLASILFQIESGLGIMIAPGTIREVAGSKLRFIELDYPDKYFDVMVAWNQHSKNASLPIFVKHILSCFKDQQIY